MKKILVLILALTMVFGLVMYLSLDDDTKRTEELIKTMVEYEYGEGYTYEILRADESEHDPEHTRYIISIMPEGGSEEDFVDMVLIYDTGLELYYGNMQYLAENYSDV